MNINFFLATMLIRAACGSAIFEILSDPPINHPTLSNHDPVINDNNRSNKEVKKQTNSFEVIFDMTIGTIVISFSGFTVSIAFIVLIYRKSRLNGRINDNHQLMPHQLELVNFGFCIKTQTKKNGLPSCYDN
jgi:hypothetical protein